MFTKMLNVCLSMIFSLPCALLYHLNFLHGNALCIMFVIRENINGEKWGNLHYKAI